MHYATRYKERIRFLESKIKDYYMVNYHAKQAVGIDPGMCCVPVMEGAEESLCIMEPDGMKQIINELPLWDCGV